jgi:hypothetical protein
METRVSSVSAPTISDLSFELKEALEANSRVVASDAGNIEQLSFIQKQTEGLTEKIAYARREAKTGSDREKLSELAIGCDKLLDSLREATGQF